MNRNSSKEKLNIFLFVILTIIEKDKCLLKLKSQNEESSLKR